MTVSDIRREICYGCHAPAVRHPWVAISIDRVDPNDPSLVHSSTCQGPGTARAVTACNACWLDPAHQTVQQIPGHYFDRSKAETACAAAGASSIG